MSLDRRTVFALALVAGACLLGCSDDDDDPVVPEVPEDPRVESVVVAPGSAIYNALGEEIQFAAMAFDQNEAVIDTVITWQSSDPTIVSVDENGGTLATGLGDAQIYAMAGSAADTADVTVTLDGAASTEWIAGGNGNWEDAGNWSGGEVPGSGDVAVITAAGDYTVTLNDDVTVDGLVLGEAGGTQTLDTNNNILQVTTGGLYPGGELLVQNGFTVLGDVVWAGGDVSGSGLIEIASSAELHVTGSPVNVDADIDNAGSLTAYSGSSLNVNESLNNRPGGIVELHGGAFLSVQLNGMFTSTGTILKSQGLEEASIVASSDSDFEFAGSLRVETGSLSLRGGTLRGSVDIAAGAHVHQLGNTNLESLNSIGDGDFVVGGHLNVGTWESQIVDFRNLVLDSGTVPALSGPASILVSHSLVWRRGIVADLGFLGTQGGSETSFEAGDIKALSGVPLSIRGTVIGDGNVELSLNDGAIVTIESQGAWMQTAGGSITQGTGDSGRFEVDGEFLKTGEGAFTVETGLFCSGTMDLREGVVVAQGEFNLFDTGVLTGGGTADLTENLRLNVVNATSAIVRGTIRPDLDGEPARLDILGTPVLESTASIELDVITSGSFDTESVYFLTGGQVFGGTLDLRVLEFPSDGSEYKVIHALDSTGEFDVDGGDVFYYVDQTENGVVCRR